MDKKNKFLKSVLFVPVLFFSVLLLLSCSQESRIFIESNNYSAYFNSVLKPRINENGYIVFNNDKDISDFLVKNIHNLHILIPITKENIEYANYIDIITGKPYKKKILKFDESENFEITEDNSTRFLYEPDSPFADSQGDVHYPNIILSVEKEVLEYYIRLNNFFVDILSKKNKSIYFPKF